MRVSHSTSRFTARTAKEAKPHTETSWRVAGKFLIRTLQINNNLPDSSEDSLLLSFPGLQVATLQKHGQTFPGRTPVSAHIFPTGKLNSGQQKITRGKNKRRRYSGPTLPPADLASTSSSLKEPLNKSRHLVHPPIVVDLFPKRDDAFLG